MTTILRSAIPLVLVLFSSGCAYMSKPSSRNFSEVARATASRDAAMAKGLMSPGAPGGEFTQGIRLAQHQQPTEPAHDSADTTQARRIVIYNAAFRIVVRNVEASIKAMEAIAEGLGGYVQGIHGDQITIRVPVAKYDEAVERTERLGQVAHRASDAVDVTEEYVDLESRLRNAENVRDRLQSLLDKAENVTAALEVEKELNRVNEEIERLKGKLQLIQNRVAFSTISVTFERVYRDTPTPMVMKLPFQWLRELSPDRLMRSDY